MTTTSTTPPSLRDDIRARHRCDEVTALAPLLPLARLSEEGRARVVAQASELMTTIRAIHRERGGLDAFLHEYDLSSHEGVVLMCMAEALLRIPDAATVDRLIQDKIGAADWARHVARSDSLFVNASNWALMLTGRIVNFDNAEETLAGAGKRLLARAGEPLIRQGMRAAMRLLGEQFIMGRSIGEALANARPAEQRGYRHSYDMLGEAALSMADAERYHAAYRCAIDAIGAARAEPRGELAAAPSISIKLSALHPRYETAQRARVMTELLPAVRQLAEQARRHDIGLTIDAEESDRLELSLDIFAALAVDPALSGWQGLGLAVQAYQKRAPAVIDWLAEVAHSAGRRLPVRLVKGAYWDTEIKLAQERGLADYPVYTRKVATDIAYLACAAKLLDDPVAFYPQFATHNALSVATILEMARSRSQNRNPGESAAPDFEFQRLHGMGGELYDQIVGLPEVAGAGRHPCRVYAPVGSHEDLLAYLVRRLLENGANSSFVHRLEDGQTPLEQLVADPVDIWQHARPPRLLALPRKLYGATRLNSSGLDLSDTPTLATLADALDASRRRQFRAAPTIAATALDAATDNGDRETETAPIFAPADPRDSIGSVRNASAADINAAIAAAAAAQRAWDATPAKDRAACLERAADLLEQQCPDLMALIVREGGRTLPDALNEVREAVDFCRYYAAGAREEFAAPRELVGPTGERNLLSLHGRGVFACISPWNFPLAIFIGQAAAALATGNAVIAKPAEQTPLTAAIAVDLLHQAGIPMAVLQLLPGDGRVGAALVSDPRIDGVAFTGSTETARLIARALVARGDGDTATPLVPLIAETGGLNVMIADSSAQPEQLVRDVVASAFNSAGQRCSALRVLFVQNDIADRVMRLLAGAMQELTIGDPALITTDVGPLIDEAARAALETHVAWLESAGRPIHRCVLPPECANGHYFAPQAWEIDSLAQLRREVFGPILHVIRWRADDLDQVLAAIDASDYGLTLGIHSRIDATVARIAGAARVGNLYVNRNMIGAVVGVQPFGGERLSGTGPKAGGPHYLLRFATERCLTINTTAAGGNATLMATAADRTPP